MSNTMPLPSTRRPTASRFPGFEGPGEVLARQAAERLDAPIAAIRLEPGQVVSHLAAPPGGRVAGLDDLWAALTSHLWYTRTAVATSNASTAGGPGSPPPRAGVRAWLATPILSTRGAFLGAFCVADVKPREWSAQDFVDIEEFASAVSRQLAYGELPAARPAWSGRTRSANVDSIASFAAAFEALVRKGESEDEPLGADAAEAIAQLERALEELRITIEDLNATNEELQVARCVVEVEREHYRELFETVPYPYLTTDDAGIIREANEAAVGLFGCRRALLVGKHLANFVGESARAGFRTRLKQLKTGGRSEWPLQVAPREQPAKLMMCAASAARSRESGAERVYWLFRELHEQDASEARGQIEAISAERDPAARSDEDFEELVTRATIDPGLPVARQLHGLIAGALDVGTLQIGQRLPSIRSIADRFGVTSYHALQAYAALEAEGVVERRERSGVYVASLDWPQPPRLPETAEWVAAVLTQACGHQLRVPQLPDLIRKWTTSVAIRAVCVESCADTSAALSHELTNRFGVTAATVSIDELVGPDGAPRRKSTLPPALLEAHFLVTTAYHASQARTVAEAIGKPLLVATTNPEIIDAITGHAEQRNLTVICVDPEYGNRVRELSGGAYRNRIQVALVDEVDPAAFGGDPVFATHAARQKLSGAPLRLVAPLSPAFSLDFARKVAATLLRLNLNAGTS